MNQGQEGPHLSSIQAQQGLAFPTPSPCPPPPHREGGNAIDPDSAPSLTPGLRNIPDMKGPRLKLQSNKLGAPLPASHPEPPKEKLSPGKGEKKSQRDKVILKYFPSLQSLREEGVRGEGGWKGGQRGFNRLR